MATVHFHGGAETFGLLTAAPGVGAVLGGMLSGWLANIRFQGRAVLIAVVIWGLAIACFGFVSMLWIGLILLGIAGWQTPVSQTMRTTILQVETPNRLRGRLSSLHSTAVQAGQLGNAEAGLVASLSNAQVSIVSGGLGCVLGVFIIALLIPSYARYRLDEHVLDQDFENE